MVILNLGSRIIEDSVMQNLLQAFDNRITQGFAFRICV